MSPRGFHVLDVLLWSLVGSILLVLGSRHSLGTPLLDVSCVLGGSMLAVLAIWRAWGLR